MQRRARPLRRGPATTRNNRYSTRPEVLRINTSQERRRPTLLNRPVLLRTSTLRQWFWALRVRTKRTASNSQKTCFTRSRRLQTSRRSSATVSERPTPRVTVARRWVAQHRVTTIQLTKPNQTYATKTHHRWTEPLTQRRPLSRDLGGHLSVRTPMRMRKAKTFLSSDLAVWASPISHLSPSLPSMSAPPVSCPLRRPKPSSLSRRASSQCLRPSRQKPSSPA